MDTNTHGIRVKKIIWIHWTLDFFPMPFSDATFFVAQINDHIKGGV
jgi:hypothetical protein